MYLHNNSHRHRLKSLSHAQFYDRYISRLQSTRIGRGQRPAILVGVGFAEQLVGTVPTSILDHRLNYLVLPHTVIAGKEIQQSKHDKIDSNETFVN